MVNSTYVQRNKVLLIRKRKTFDIYLYKIKKN